MDPLGTAVGVASLGIQICQGLLFYYDGWKSYHTDLSSTYQGIADLFLTFDILRNTLENSPIERKGKESREALTRVGLYLNSCSKSLLRLQKTLDQLKIHGNPRGIRQKTWAEMQRAWYPFRASTLTKLKEDVGHLRSDLSLALQTLQQITVEQGFDCTTKELSELLSGQQAAKSQVSDVLLNQQATKQRDMIDWLSPPDPYYNHNAARQRHEPGTGKWLLESDEYQLWRIPTSTNAVIWLTGKAGCGKTVLCSTVIEDIRSLPGIQLAVFYFSFSDIRKQSYAGLLASLITQLSQSKDAFDQLQRVYDRIYPSQPPTEILEEMLLACLRQPKQTVLVLDALDEVPEHDHNNGRLAILAWLGHVMRETYRTKVFVTSRPLTDIQMSVMSLSACCVQVHSDVANSDIQKYITTELNNHPRLSRLSASTKEDVERVFAQKANGMFRWAFCQLESLKSLKSTKPKHIQMALDSLPRSLDETYERMLLQIDEILWDEAVSALRWLVFETRPLTLGELADALLINYTGDDLVDVQNRGQIDDILEILAGLVVTEDPTAYLDDEIRRANNDDMLTSGDDEENDLWSLKPAGKVEDPSFKQVCASFSIQLAHFSVKEYLLSSRILESKAAKFALKEDIDRPILAQSCLAYVLYYSQSSLKTRTEQDLDTYPFLEYAATSWPTLFTEYKTTETALERHLLQSETCRRDWLAVHNPDEPNVPPFCDCDDEKVAPGLYYASLMGLFSLCQIFIDRGANANAQGGKFGNALQAASKRGSPEIVKLLLDRGAADVNNQGGYYGNALQAASNRGHAKVVKLLLDSQADVNTQGGHYGNALQAATERCDQEVLKLLLEAGADVNAQGGKYHTALLAASEEGDQGVVKLLLEAGADTSIAGDEYGDALCTASQWGCLEVVELLLDSGSDVNACDSKHRNALESASYMGHLQIVKLLLNRGATIHVPGSYYGDALQAASFCGRKEVVKQLLEAGADVNNQGGIFGNSLQAASRRGYPEVISLLLDSGSDIYAQGGHYGSALGAASETGDERIIQLLLGGDAVYVDPQIIFRTDASPFGSYFHQNLILASMSERRAMRKHARYC